MHGARACTKDGIHQSFLPFARNYLRPGMRILDLGCGEGAMTERLSEEGHAVFACDILNRFRAGKGAFVRADLGSGLPFAEGCFDAVVCIEVLEHMRDPFGALREMNRILRRGGTLLLTTPNASSMKRRLRFLCRGAWVRFTPLDAELYARGGAPHISLLPVLLFGLRGEGLELVEIGCSWEKKRFKERFFATAVKLINSFWSCEKREEWMVDIVQAPPALFGDALFVVARKKCSSTA